MITQTALLPERSTVHPLFTFEAFYKAARQVGGDWYGLRHNEATARSYLAIGDVTGHGLASALVTGSASGAFNSAIESIVSQGSRMTIEEEVNLLVTAINAAIHEICERTNKLITMSFLVVDYKSMAGVLVNAGHCPSFHIKARGGTKALMNFGSPIGINRFAERTPTRFSLARGDLIFLYTDGLTENHDGQEKRFNQKDFTRYLSAAIPSLRRMIVFF